MTAVYRIKTSLLEFGTVGRLEKVEDVYLLRCQATTDQAFAVERDMKAKKAIEIFAMSGHEVALPGRAARVIIRPDGPRVELACILG